MRRGGFLPASNNADAQLPVGSLIKLLTAQTAYAAGNPVKVVAAPPGLIVDPEESRIGITDGQELPRDLLDPGDAHRQRQRRGRACWPSTSPAARRSSPS